MTQGGGRPTVPSEARPRSGFATHTPNERGEWHDLLDHLEGVARRAREFGQKFDAGDWALFRGMPKCGCGDG
jgi:hypothetical protein